MAKEGGPFESCKRRRFGSGRRSLKPLPRPTISASCARTEGDVSRPAARARLGAPDAERFTEHAGVRRLGRTAGCICTAGVCRSADLQGHKDRLPKLGVFPRGEGSFGDIREGTPRPMEAPSSTAANFSAGSSGQACYPVSVRYDRRPNYEHPIQRAQYRVLYSC